MSLFKKRKKEVQEPELHLELYSEEEMDVIEKKIQEIFGPYEEVFHEIYSPDIHCDVVVVPPTEDRDFYYLVTMGMGAHKMHVPEEMVRYGTERAELAIAVPKDWNIKSAEEKDYWPMRWLKTLARYPGDYDTWLGYGHTVSAGDPFDDSTQMNGFILSGAKGRYGDADRIVAELPNGEVVNFYQIIPVYEEEMAFKLEKDADALFAVFSEEGFPLVVNPNRKKLI